MLSRGDARHLPFRAGIFDLVLFSPPYYERRQYGDDRRELGHEATPALYVDELLRVLDECERVLTRDGSVWVNIGDTYAGSGGAGVSIMTLPGFEMISVVLFPSRSFTAFRKL